MNPLGSLLLGIVASACSTPPRALPPVEPEPPPAPVVAEEPKAAPHEEPKPVPAEEPPASKPEEPKPVPVEEPPSPKAEEPKPDPSKGTCELLPPSPPKTSPEAKALLLDAAKRQGTDGLVGGLAPTRFRAFFKMAILFGEKGKVEVRDSTEAFALPAPGARESRMRSEASIKGETVVVGHNGRFGWRWTPGEPAREYRDREQYADDIKDIDQRRRMLRLAVRVFFLGEMADGSLPVTLLPDEEKTFPVGPDARAMTLKCRVLERARDEKSGEPALRIYLDAATLDPVGVVLLPAKEGEPAFLLTMAYEEEPIRAKKEFPKGVRVPDWIEMFEMGEKPVLRIQAGFQGLEIDAAKVPDSLFDPPKSK